MVQDNLFKTEQQRVLGFKRNNTASIWYLHKENFEVEEAKMRKDESGCPG